MGDKDIYMESLPEPDERLTGMALIRHRVDNLERLTDADINRINSDIRVRHHNIADAHEYDMAMAYSYEEDALYIEGVRNSEGLDPETEDIPAYVSEELGTLQGVSAVRQQGLDIASRAQETYDSEIDALYGDVYELQRLDLDSLPIEVVGRGPHGRARIQLISDWTLRDLGEPYKEYTDRRFDERLEEIRAAHVPHGLQEPGLNDLFGIDITKPMGDPGMEHSVKQSYKDASKQQEDRDLPDYQPPDEADGVVPKSDKYDREGLGE